MTDSAAIPPLHGPALRSLQRDLVSAEDAQIVRVLTIVDNLASRGEADRLIAPLRGRLAELRPRRPLSLSRLLIIPLEPLVVDGTAWRPEMPSIPRTALLPLAQQVTQQIGASTGTIATACARLSRTDDLELIVATGADLWLRAATILAVAPVPPGWTAASGLRAAHHAALAGTMAILLAQAPVLLGIVVLARAGIEPDPDDLRAILASVAPAGALPLTMMIAMAMAWLPQPEALIRVADEFVARQDDPTIRATADQAVDFVLEGIERSPLRSANLVLATQEVRRIAIMLKDIELCSEQRVSRRWRIEQIRRGVDAACRERFASEVEAQLPVLSAAMATVGDEAMSALESTARDLRRFEVTARQIGGAEHYDRQLRRTAEALRPAAGEDDLAQMGRIRLVEILQGSDDAMAMLTAGDA